MRDRAVQRSRRDHTFRSQIHREETLAWLLTANATCLAAATQLAFAILRETPSFWRNAGGYPVGFRHFVANARSAD